MNSATTNNIRISVRTQYRPDHSKPADNRYVFAYRIRIENMGQHIVQLLRRHWVITDSLGHTEEVEGEGVIGQQPILNPGQVHTYDSWCPIRTPLGAMEGTYLMQNREDFSSFHARVPRFFLESPIIQN